MDRIKSEGNRDLIKRIDVLETHIVHQSTIIDELNDVSIKQWLEIEKLNDRFNHLRNIFSELERDIESPPDKALPPPHY